MNLKYYLRGLGLGIVLTAVLMGIMSGGKERLTDEEIIVKAKALGMVEETVLNDSVAKAKDETATQLRNEIKQELSVELEEKLRKEIEAEYAEPETEQVEAPIEFIVNSGETAQSIGERLAEMGLVSSADEFIQFMKLNGFDRSIVAKNYTIPSGADMDTIARIITKKEEANE